MMASLRSVCSSGEISLRGTNRALVVPKVSKRMSSKGTLWMLVSSSGTNLGTTEEPSGTMDVGSGLAALVD